MGKHIATYAKVFRGALREMGFADVDRKAAAFELRLSEMYASDAFTEHNVYPTMNVTLVYAVIAMCLELREYGLGDDEIIVLVNGAFKKRKAIVDALAKLVNQLPNSYKIAERWNIADHGKRVEDGSITYDDFSAGNGRVEYRISHCMYVEMFEHYGIRRLCKIFCMTDVDAYEKISKHIEFIRHSDLSDGDCCHDEVIRKARDSRRDSRGGKLASRIARKTRLEEKMPITENFGNPQGLVGSLMLSGMNMGHTPMAKWGFAQFETPKTAIAVDLGCGGGYNVKRLLECCPNGHVFGVDISGESVRKSIAVNKKDVGKRCDIVQASVEALPFDDQVLDLATAFETVYFWPDIAENFKEVRRVLRDGGHFVVVNDPGDPNKHWEDKIPGMKAYTAEEIAGTMEAAGFSDIRITREKNMFCVNGTAAG